MWSQYGHRILMSMRKGQVTVRLRDIQNSSRRRTRRRRLSWVEFRVMGNSRRFRRVLRVSRSEQHQRWTRWTYWSHHCFRTPYSTRRKYSKRNDLLGRSQRSFGQTEAWAGTHGIRMSGITPSTQLWAPKTRISSQDLPISRIRTVL